MERTKDETPLLPICHLCVMPREVALCIVGKGIHEEEVSICDACADLARFFGWVVAPHPSTLEEGE